MKYICKVMIANTSIKALVQLIDDPDDNIYEHVRDQLKQYGNEAIPYLESSWGSSYYGMVFQSRVEKIIHEIQFESIKAQVQSWANSSEKDLLEGALIIARYQYPGVDEEFVRNTIQAIRRDVWLELNNNQTAFEQIKIFNRVFFGVHGFHGDTKTYNSPVNSYINTVLESKKGNPLSLSLIYSIVAQSLDIPVYGVNLPNHFVLAYMDEKRSSFMINEQNEFGVLFYINAFSKGVIFDTNEIKDFLNGNNLTHSREFFEPCSNSTIMKRMLSNLIVSFQQIGNAEKVMELQTLRSVLM
jgi:regulator of sirC expression with transglutaminase-like and TPR domain